MISNASDFFHAIQVKKEKLASEEDLADFFVAHGVDKAAFHDAYNSFIVDTKMRQAKAMGPRYGITGVPALVVNGKYLVNART
jgi:thiol:disulfide interchange protein DsbA